MTTPLSMAGPSAAALSTASGGSTTAGRSAAAPAFARALGQAVSDREPGPRTPERPADQPAERAATRGMGTEKSAGKNTDEDTGDHQDIADPAAPTGLPNGPVPPAVWAMLAAGLGTPSPDGDAAPAATADALPGGLSVAAAGSGGAGGAPAALSALLDGTATGAAPGAPVSESAPASAVAAGRSDVPAIVPTVLPPAALAHSQGLTVVAAPSGTGPAAAAPPGADPGADPAARFDGGSDDGPDGAPSPVSALLLPGTTPSGAGGQPADPDTDQGTGTAPAAEPGAAPDADTTSVTASAPPVAVGATTATPAAAAPGRNAPVAAQLAPQLAVLRSAPDGTQTMTLVVTPDSLGPVAVHVTITDGTLDMTLHGASAHGRHALTDALPDLRRDLENAGLTLARLQVDADTGGSGQDARSAQQLLADARAGTGGSGSGGHQSPHQSSHQDRPRAWAPPGTHLGEGGPVLTSAASASTGVDVRA